MIFANKEVQEPLKSKNPGFFRIFLDSEIWAAAHFSEFQSSDFWAGDNFSELSMLEHRLQNDLHREDPEPLVSPSQRKPLPN